MHFPTPVRKHALGSIVAYINQLFFLDSLVSILPGGQSGEVTPVPIPNTEVKSTNGEGTVGVAHGRVARCQAFFIRARTIHLVRALFLCQTRNLPRGDAERAEECSRRDVQRPGMRGASMTSMPAQGRRIVR